MILTLIIKFLIHQKAQYINSDISNKIPPIRNKKVVALWDDHTHN